MMAPTAIRNKQFFSILQKYFKNIKRRTWIKMTEIDELANGLQYLYHSETDSIFAYVEYCFECLNHLQSQYKSPEFLNSLLMV